MDQQAAANSEEHLLLVTGGKEQDAINELSEKSGVYTFEDPKSFEDVIKGLRSGERRRFSHKYLAVPTPNFRQRYANKIGRSKNIVVRVYSGRDGQSIEKNSLLRSQIRAMLSVPSVFPALLKNSEARPYFVKGRFGLIITADQEEGSLDQLIKDKQPSMTLGELSLFLAKAVENLKSLHDAGIVHMRFGLSNICEKKRSAPESDDANSLGEPLFTDVGAYVAPHDGRVGGVISLRKLVAPEIMDAVDPSSATDVYSVGVTLAEAIVRFSVPDWNFSPDELFKIRSADSTVSGLLNLSRDCTSIDAAMRPPAFEIIARLKRSAHDLRLVHDVVDSIEITARVTRLNVGASPASHPTKSVTDLKAELIQEAVVQTRPVQGVLVLFAMFLAMAGYLHGGSSQIFVLAPIILILLFELVPRVVLKKKEAKP